MTEKGKDRNALFGSRFHPPSLFDGRGHSASSEGEAPQEIPSELPQHKEWSTGDSRVVSKLSQDEVERRLLDIVQVEGPLLVERAFRLADLKPPSKPASRKAQPMLELVLDNLIGKGLVHGESHPGCRVVALRSQPLCHVRSLGPRPMEEVPATELAEVMRRSGLGPNDKKSMHLEVLQTYGLSRAPSKAVERLLASAYRHFQHA